MLDSAPQINDTSNQDAQPREYRLRFTGKGSEYFSIWIVNLLLSIVTFGIYSAWAKVRREQYFHRNTLLDEHPFDYTGDPQKILKGRVIALIVLAIGSTLQKVNVPLALCVIAAYAVLYPWVIVRGLKFRARNTRYRNIAFAFTGTTKEAIKAFCWIYIAFLPFVFVSIYFGPEIAQINTHKADSHSMEALSGVLRWLYISMGISFLLSAALWPMYLARKQSFIHRHVRYGNAQGNFDGSARDFLKALLKVAGVTVIAIILMSIIIGIISIFKSIWALPFIYLVLVLPSAAYKVFTVNTTYTHSSIGDQRMHADMNVARYARLLLANLSLIVITLGFAWPWIQVRLARYRCQHLALIAPAAVFETIIGEAQQNPSALGEEMAEFLDFDISL